jgi:hypothetical protein
MANRIIINGNQNRNESIFGHGDGSLGLGGDRSSQASQDAAPERTGISSGDRQNTVTPPLDENVWGNDRDILDKLDKEVLADRRLFVRVRYIQRITCNAVYEDIEKEPVFLSRPLEFITVDISAAGIGIVCEHEIEPGKILGIRISLDRMPYDIKCRVIYCIPLEGKYRAGLKIAAMDKRFMRHLKIFVARITLTGDYACGE